MVEVGAGIQRCVEEERVTSGRSLQLVVAGSPGQDVVSVVSGQLIVVAGSRYVFDARQGVAPIILAGKKVDGQSAPRRRVVCSIGPVPPSSWSAPATAAQEVITILAIEFVVAEPAIGGRCPVSIERLRHSIGHYREACRLRPSHRDIGVVGVGSGKVGSGGVGSGGLIGDRFSWSEQVVSGNCR
jgi:hypothetical protein